MLNTWLIQLLKRVAKTTKEELLVSDTKLASCIKQKFDIPCLTDTPVQELMRAIRSQVDSLIGDIPSKEMAAFALGVCEPPDMIISALHM